MENLAALVRGRFAGCYSLHAPDGTVHAVSLAVRRPDGTELARFSRLSLRPGLPLQATLFALVEQAARSLETSDVDRDAQANVQIDLTVGWDPAMHGSVNEPDLRGFSIPPSVPSSCWRRRPGSTIPEEPPTRSSR